LSNPKPRSLDKNNSIEEKHKQSQSWEENKKKKRCQLVLTFQTYKSGYYIGNTLFEKRISITQKNSKQKMTIKRMMVKIKIQNKSYFLLKMKLKIKINWIKWSKNNQKNKDQDWNKKIKIIF
jgi:hypothetical protein